MNRILSNLAERARQLGAGRSGRKWARLSAVGESVVAVWLDAPATYWHTSTTSSHRHGLLRGSPLPRTAFGPNSRAIEDNRGHLVAFAAHAGAALRLWKPLRSGLELLRTHVTGTGPGATIWCVDVRGERVLVALRDGTMQLLDDSLCISRTWRTQYGIPHAAKIVADDLIAVATDSGVALLDTEGRELERPLRFAPIIKDVAFQGRSLLLNNYNGRVWTTTPDWQLEERPDGSVLGVGSSSAWIISGTPSTMRCANWRCMNGRWDEDFHVNLSFESLGRPLAGIAEVAPETVVLGFEHGLVLIDRTSDPAFIESRVFSESLAGFVGLADRRIAVALQNSDLLRVHYILPRGPGARISG